MPRAARKESRNGMYHVIARGNAKQNIFYEKTDYREFLRLTKKASQKYDFKIYAYCLMGNHIHILIYTDFHISEIMKYTFGLYAKYFNERYSRRGHLFQERFGSKPVESIQYFYAVMAYIHRNPVEAGLVRTMEEYFFSSYRDYLNRNDYLVSVNDLLKDIGIPGFQTIHRIKYKDEILNINNIDHRIPEPEARNIICRILKTDNPLVFTAFTPTQQIELIKEINKERVSNAQVARVTGMPYERVRYLMRRDKEGKSVEK